MTASAGRLPIAYRAYARRYRPQLPLGGRSATDDDRKRPIRDRPPSLAFLGPHRRHMKDAKDLRRTLQGPARRPRPGTAKAMPSGPSSIIMAAETAQSIGCDLHPILKATGQKLLGAQPVGGLAKAGGKGAFSVSVSPQQANRALVILSSLLQATQAQGWSVARSDKGLQLGLNGEAVNFTLIERTDRVRHKVTDAERETLARFAAKRAAAARKGDWFGAGDPPQIPDWDYRPTGYLVFQLDPNPCAFEAATGLRRTFSESRSRRLEDQLETIIQAMDARAAAQKDIRRLAAERDARWADETAKREEAERRQRLEIRRQAFLEGELARHEAARRLAGFLARYDHGDLREEPEPDRFLTWARDRLARLERDLTRETQEARYAQAGLARDDPDTPS